MLVSTHSRVYVFPYLWKLHSTPSSKPYWRFQTSSRASYIHKLSCKFILFCQKAVLLLQKSKPITTWVSHSRQSKKVRTFQIFYKYLHILSQALCYFFHLYQFIKFCQWCWKEACLLVWLLSTHTFSPNRAKSGISWHCYFAFYHLLNTNVSLLLKVVIDFTSSSSK